MSELCPSESSVTSSVGDRGKLKHDIISPDKFISTQVSSIENTTLFDIKPVNCEEQKLEVYKQDIVQQHLKNPPQTNIFSENGISLLKENEILKELNKNEVSETKSETDLNTNSNVNEDFPVNQIMNDKEIISQSTSKKKSKKNKVVQSLKKTEDQSLSKNAEKGNSELLKTSPKKPPLQTNFYKNSVEIEKKVMLSKATAIEDLNCTDNSVQSLLQRCDSLISKLEELTADIKNDFNSSRNTQIINQTHFCNRQIENCRTVHHGCCMKIIHSCCCRKFCKC